jgi:hypothetical protein
MRVNANAANVAALTKELKRRWEETTASWRDTQSIEFEQHYLAPLFDCADTAVAMIDKLDQALAKIHSDCD